MNKIPTAEDILIKESILLKTIEESGNFPLNLTRDTHIGTAKDIKKAMIEFAKLHVEAFRKEVSENVSLIKECGKENSLNCNAVFCRSCLDIINKDSILNAYPLTNIK